MVIKCVCFIYVLYWRIALFLLFLQFLLLQHCRPSFLPAVRASDSKNQLKTPEDSLSDCRQAVQAAEDAVSAADEKSSWEEKFSAIFTVKNFGFFMLYALNVTSYTLKYEVIFNKLVSSARHKRHRGS